MHTYLGNDLSAEFNGENLAIAHPDGSLNLDPASVERLKTLLTGPVPTIKTFLFSYSGSVIIKAANEEEAQEKFDDLTASQLADNLEDHNYREMYAK